MDELSNGLRKCCKYSILMIWSLVIDITTTRICVCVYTADSYTKRNDKESIPSIVLKIKDMGCCYILS